MNQQDSASRGANWVNVRKKLGSFFAATVVAAASLTTLTDSPAVSAGGHLDPWLADRLGHLGAGDAVSVVINADTVDNARAAADAEQMRVVASFPRIGTVVATGVAVSVGGLAGHPGVEWVGDADQPLVRTMDTSHEATRAVEAAATFTAPTGGPFDGSGVGVMVIDGGIDGTHPMFVDEFGESKVKRNLEVLPLAVILNQQTLVDTLVVDDLDGDNNTDDVAGHGTHVAGTVAGYARTTSTGRTVVGAAPGATLYGISVATAGSTYYGALAAQYWVLEHHDDPCGDGTCPAIKSVNNSYGPIGGAPYNPTNPTNEIQRTTIAEGVTWVWAAGNDGGDGSTDTTGGNPKEPTPGVLSVAAYDDGDQGNRDNAMASFSSRGAASDTSTWPDISAPGVNIQSACRLQFTDCATDVLNDTDPDYGDLSGTSMASPHIAGYVALLIHADPTLTPGEIEDVLEDTAYEFGDATYAPDPTNPDSLSSFDRGHGLVDVTAALARVLGTTSTAYPGGCATERISDPEGDATALASLVDGLPGLPTPDVDIVGVTATEQPTQTVRFQIEVADLPEAPNSAGDAVRSFLTAAGVPYTLDMNRDAADPSAPTAVLSKPDPNGVTGTESIRVGTYTPVFDAENDVAYVDLPIEVLGVTGHGALGGVQVLWRRSFEALAAPADDASATCSLRIIALSEPEPTKPGKGLGRDKPKPKPT